ncbi:hypothetical protein Pla52o_13150 [Novipirellula galeiformis]|uniref:Carboxypeptidase regulatory-like domain-containing protein n=1 Tax=Novipirellula galeiformis TaxID=2528004 RepID=A0A5C6CKP4_9BACT|nr:hypothetical protein [Novipirellula galeiformis]TWU25018.1 hypothetical protein Pla52o_13150 [Novipirellula galeiformis]
MVTFRRLRCSSAFLTSAIVLAGVLPWVGGCENSADYPTGTIQGRISYEGQPLQQGVVTFYSSELGVGISEEVQGDGQYATQTPIRTGSYVVTVLPPEVPPTMDEVPAANTTPVKDIPETYRDPAKSGLKLEVTEGENSFDIEMTN